MCDNGSETPSDEFGAKTRPTTTLDDTGSPYARLARLSALWVRVPIVLKIIGIKPLLIERSSASIRVPLRLFSFACLHL
jgi:hypothetical protein